MGNCLSNNKGTAGGTKDSAPQNSKAADGQIRQWIRAAKEELENGKKLRFSDHYETSKIVGHGAFAKVVLSTHKATKSQYAVKMLQKNVEDTVKQRDGVARLGYKSSDVSA
jgi:serine/threonine protein kinase